MWSPTHVQVTVQRARGLLTKGKNNTNNCFVTIGLGKEKYQTSVKDKSEANVSWNEECELKIPDQGNRAELVLTCLHRNNIGIDEFLGQTTLPLNEMDAYDRPRSKWYKLESKPGKEKKNKDRGELEVRIAFIVKSGSLSDLSKKDKHKSSIGQLASSVGGSLLSIGTIEKRKGLKNLGRSLGSKLHLNSKKKNKDVDNISYNGSLTSIGTPNSSNGGGRQKGQRAGEADPGVISEDEDEFAFDNLSHKSSGSSLNVRSSLQPPTQKFVPRNPSPLLGGKVGGKRINNIEEDQVDPELEEIENDFSVRARTLPPPSKPSRTPQLALETSPQSKSKREEKLDEWEKKLYGKNFEIGSSDSLKRRSWETSRVPLPTTSEETNNIKNEDEMKKEENLFVSATSKKSQISLNSDSTSESEEEEQEVPEVIKTDIKSDINGSSKKSEEITIDVTPKVVQHNNRLFSSDDAENSFDQFNASFAKFEQRNSAKIFDLDSDKKLQSKSFIAEESKAPKLPQAMPRNRDKEMELKQIADEREIERKEQEIYEQRAKEERERKAEEEYKLRIKEEEELKRRAEEDARLEEELRLNEQRLQEEEEAMQEELCRKEEEKRREAKRREEDQRILNFPIRSLSHEEEDRKSTTPEQSPKERIGDNMKEKRVSKFKYSNKRDQYEDEKSTLTPKSNERIIIGHEKATTHAERRSEITAALTKKYEGKSREELMLIANGMENEALLQRQRVKELEDYLDNLLLRVMETHPRILQNPYSRTTSAKSFKNYINMNDFL